MEDNNVCRVVARVSVGPSTRATSASQDWLFLDPLGISKSGHGGTESFRRYCFARYVKVFVEENNACRVVARASLGPSTRATSAPQDWLFLHPLDISKTGHWVPSSSADIVSTRVTAKVSWRMAMRVACRVSRVARVSLWPPT